MATITLSNPDIRVYQNFLTYEWTLNGLGIVAGDVAQVTLSKDEINDIGGDVFDFVIMTHKSSSSSSDTREIRESNDSAFSYAYYLRAINASSSTSGDTWSNISASNLQLGPCLVDMQYIRPMITFATAPSGVSDRLKLIFLKSIR